MPLRSDAAQNGAPFAANVGRHTGSHIMQLLVNVDVDDIEPAIEFYQSAIGLRLGRRLFEGSVAEMLGASSRIYLLAKPQGSVPSRHASSIRDYHRHWTPVHLDFEVEDIVAATDRKSTRLNSSHGKLSRMPSSA